MIWMLMKMTMKIWMKIKTKMKIKIKLKIKLKIKTKMKIIVRGICFLQDLIFHHLLQGHLIPKSGKQMVNKHDMEELRNTACIIPGCGSG